MKRQLDARVTVEMAEWTKAALEEWAREEDRSISSLLRRLAEQGLRERGAAALAVR